MATLRRFVVALVVGCWLAGCSMGPRVADWAPASQAGGTDVTLYLGEGRRVAGELLGLDSTGLVVREPLRLVHVAFAAVRGGEAFRTGITKGVPGQELRRRLRLMSRYPQGITPPIERGLLETYGFSAMEQET